MRGKDADFHGLSTHIDLALEENETHGSHEAAMDGQP